jgi:hypothetical protein
MLAITVQSKSPIEIRLRVAHAYQPNTDYTDRSAPLTGKQIFYVRMPIPPKTVVVQLYNKANGDQVTGADASIKIIDYKLLPLDTFPEIYDSKNPLIQEGIKFLKEFSQRAAILSAGLIGSIYQSDKKRFRIDYLDAIVDRREEIQTKSGQVIPNPNFGKVQSTPARISRDRGIIEWAKPACLQYAVPYRFGITCHEIGHFYINTDPRDEFEADENGIKIMIGCGFGFIDACDAFLSVFEGSPSDQNAQRTNKVIELVTKLDEKYNRYK